MQQGPGVVSAEKALDEAIRRTHVDQEEQLEQVRLEPLGDRIVILPYKAGEQIKGGIVIPELAQERPQYGEVLAVGPDVTKAVSESFEIPDRPRIQVGDTVLYGKYSGTEVEVGDEQLIVVRECDVLGILHRA
jgi:chaperonin GroES